MVYAGHLVAQIAWPKIQLASAGALLCFQHGGGGGRVEKGRDIWSVRMCFMQSYDKHI